MLHESISPDAPLPGSVKNVSACRVLIVDDDSTFIQLCKRYFRKSDAIIYEMDSAEDAHSGFVLCQSHSYDCLIIDYRLPDATGTQLLEALKESKSQEMIPPAIILTASSGHQAATDAIRSEAVDFMVKSDITPTSLAYAIDNARSKCALKNEVRENYTKLKNAYSDLQKKQKEITRFYHNVSHEVRTPLTAMREFLQLLCDEVSGQINDDQRMLLNYTNDCCDTINLHFRDLLEMTRLDTGKLTLDLAKHSLEPLLHFCVQSAMGLARDKQIQLSLNTQVLLPECVLDARRIKQVISNLIDNAIKYTESDGQINVETIHNAADGTIQIFVKDTGRGIPDAQREKIFERLYQVNQGDEHEASSEGLGLGLSIAREIIHLHAGTINLENTPGSGTTFSVLLPIDQVT